MSATVTHSLSPTCLWLYYSSPFVLTVLQGQTTLTSASKCYIITTAPYSSDSSMGAHLTPLTLFCIVWTIFNAHIHLLFPMLFLKLSYFTDGQRKQTKIFALRAMELTIYKVKPFCFPLTPSLKGRRLFHSTVGLDSVVESWEHYSVPKSRQLIKKKIK